MATLNAGLKTLSVGEQAWHSKINQNVQRLDNTYNNDSSTTRMSFDFSDITTSQFTSSNNSASAKFVGETVKVKAFATIARGDVCSLYYDTGGVIKAIPTPAGDSDDKVFGVAVEAISAGATGQIMTYGICPAKIHDGSTTTYNFLNQLGIGSSTSAGALQKVGASADTVAWCLEDGKSLNTSSADLYLCVFVMRQGEHV